ncbi:Spy/CpxP family protein refolding chaperone [Williamwhitmania taraxaci]|uniref:Protein refolding chaperone Spy/CpxP family n=1 Tax=Williamwhitmania taraxaci TaxID=1640674 RepID=A0A1G6H5L4_9BACT|nr:Spy/CpxP family protein refolding chaperone [Williamwhitmania taraxaci]SDB89424.1 protein refolding chaperone Spy/CpxP family [Williamwhitmania taraxaci]
MKTKQIIATAAISALMFIGTISANAQSENRAKMDASKPMLCDQKIPGLTEEQKTKINDLRTAHMKEVTPVKNVLAEKNARLNTLTSADKADMTEVNKTIDEIAKLKGDLMKMRVSHQTKVKALLTDEQKVYFNAHMGGKKGMGKGMHGRNGMGQGKGMHQGNGMGQGMHRNGMNKGECQNADSSK